MLVVESRKTRQVKEVYDPWMIINEHGAVIIIDDEDEVRKYYTDTAKEYREKGHLNLLHNLKMVKIPKCQEEVNKLLTIQHYGTKYLYTR